MARGVFLSLEEFNEIKKMLLVLSQARIEKLTGRSESTVYLVDQAHDFDEYKELQKERSRRIAERKHREMVTNEVASNIESLVRNLQELQGKVQAALGNG